jgi:hypothetical protein
MEELKDTLGEVRHREISDRMPMEQLIREGEALEEREKTQGVWRSMAQHKRALVYSKSAIEVR